VNSSEFATNQYEWNICCIQALLYPEFHLNTASTNVYFEFEKYPVFTRTRLPHAKIGE
jgi:hypothetical protein